MGGEDRPTGRTVLVVDDDPAVLTIVVRMLERRGHATLVADSGEAAEEMLEGEDEVDLIVADLRMPGMSGAELVRRARARRPQVAAIYMSGHTGDPPSPPEEIEATTLLEKPFTRDELLSAVDDALAGG